MDYLESIKRRRSISRYKPEELPDETLDRLIEFLSPLDPPEAGIDWNFDILPLDEMTLFLGRAPAVSAPHYLVLRAERKAFCLQNMGYIGELACLYLTGQGIGSRFIGGLSPVNEFPDVLPYVVTVALGLPDEPFYGDGEKADRKPPESVAMGDRSGVMGEIFAAARLAPSAFNKQPVSCLSLDGRLHVFRRKVPFKWPPTSYVQCIDAGAAMANACAAAWALGYDTEVRHVVPEPRWGNRIYQASILLTPRQVPQ